MVTRIDGQDIRSASIAGSDIGAGIIVPQHLDATKAFAFGTMTADGGTFSGGITGSLTRLSDGNSFIEAGRCAHIASVSNGAITVDCLGDIDAIGAASHTTGTVERLIGSFHIKQAMVFSEATALLGSSGVSGSTDSTTLTVKRTADSRTVLTLGGTPGTVRLRHSTGSVPLDVAGWHDVYISNDSATGIAECRGLKLLDPRLMPYGAYSGFFSTAGHIDCAVIDGLPFSSGSTEFTVSGRFKSVNIGSSKRTLWAAGTSILMRLTGSMMTATFPRAGGNANFRSGLDAWSDCAWHHVVMVYSGTEPVYDDRVRLYIDGQRLTGSWDAHPTGSLTDVSRTLRLGSHYTGGSYNWVGNIDEFIVWDGAATEDDIAAMTVDGKPSDPTLGSMGYPSYHWRFNTFNGDTLPAVRGGSDGTRMVGTVSRSIDSP